MTGRVRATWRALRTFLTPGWLAFHLAIWTAAVAMVLLGRWQLDVSNRRHFDLQNFGYAFQWWAFSAFAVFMWVRAIRDEKRPTGADLIRIGGRFVVPWRNDKPVPDSGYVGPAYLSSRPTDTSEAPVLYRGYVMPQMETGPTAPMDSLHGSYNDYLWQLALADEAAGGARPVGRPALSGDTDFGSPSEPERVRPVQIDSVSGDPNEPDGPT